MTNEEQMQAIRPWINPEERVTVNFLDQTDLNAEVTGCNDELVDLSLETRVPHVKQQISVALRRMDVSEDPSHYTRDPDQPLTHRRLMLTVHDQRPPIVYYKQRGHAHPGILLAQSETSDLAIFRSETRGDLPLCQRSRPGLAPP